MRLLWEEIAWEDYLYWQTQDKKNAETDKPTHSRYTKESVQRNRQAGTAKGV